MFTNRFPKDGYDFTGKRVAVVGTGSSGVQSIPVIAEQADHLHVLQRSAAYTIPSPNRVLERGRARGAQGGVPGDPQGAVVVAHRLGSVRRRVPRRRDAEHPRHAVGGTAPARRQARRDRRVRVGRRAPGRRRQPTPLGGSTPRASSASCRTRRRPKRWCRSTRSAASARSSIRATSRRSTATTSRSSTCGRTPITRVVPAGIELGDGTLLDLDAIVYATGFDAMTGALSRIDVRGRDGRRLGDEWADAPTAYLGVAVAGFPNLFTVTGPGSPSVLTNMVTSIEHHVEWITTLLDEMRASGQRHVEATPTRRTSGPITSPASPARSKCTRRAPPGTSAPTCRARSARTCRTRPVSTSTWPTVRPWPTTAIPASPAPDRIHVRRSTPQLGSAALEGRVSPRPVRRGRALFNHVASPVNCTRTMGLWRGRPPTTRRCGSTRCSVR